ncbi:MAG TPA: helicase RepA family protein [Guyparkeria sp.]|nr:helicase RepA family protein [Guyparkeria sp.]
MIDIDTNISPSENRETNPIRARESITPLQAFRGPRPQLDFVLPGFLSGTTGMIVAKGSTGKSWLAMQISASVASGMPLAGGVLDGPENTGRVLILGWEDTADVFRSRLIDLVKYYLDNDISEDTLELIDERIEVVSMHGDLSTLVDADGKPGTLVPYLLEIAPEYRLIILDPLARIFGGNENDNGHATRAIAICDAIARKSGPSILLPHHAAKYASANGQGGEQSASRGASGFVDAARWVATMQVMSEQEADKHGIDHDHRKRYVKFSLPKANYVAPISDSWMKRSAAGPLELVRLNDAKSIKDRKKKIQEDAAPDRVTDSTPLPGAQYPSSIGEEEAVPPDDPLAFLDNLGGEK